MKKPSSTPTKWSSVVSYTAGVMMATLIGAALLVPGCFSTKNQKTPDPTPKIEQAQRDVKQVAEQLPQRADRIDTNAGVIQKALPPALLPRLVPNFTGISNDTSGMRGDSQQLQQTVADLATAKKQVGELQAHSGKQSATIQKLEAEKQNGLRKLTASLIVMSIIGLGVSGALLATGTRAGLFTGIGCAVTLVGAVVVGYYSTWLAIFGGVGVLAGVGLLVRKLIVERRATTELTQTVEVAKQALTLPRRKAIFGDHARHGDADLIQSETTQTLVKVERGKQKLRAKVRLATPA